MKITKSQLKNLIKEELAAMSENTPEVPKQTQTTLEMIRTRLEQYLKTQDDIQEVVPLVMGILDIVADLNPQDYTDSEQKRTMEMLIRALQAARRAPSAEQAPAEENPV